MNIFNLFTINRISKKESPNYPKVHKELEIGLVIVEIKLMRLRGYTYRRIAGKFGCSIYKVWTTYHDGRYNQVRNIVL